MALSGLCFRQLDVVLFISRGVAVAERQGQRSADSDGGKFCAGKARLCSEERLIGFFKFYIFIKVNYIS